MREVHAKAFSVGVFISLLTAFLWLQYVASEGDRDDAILAAATLPGSAQAPTPVVAATRDRVALGPLDQDRLALLLFAEMNSDADDAYVKRLVESLAALGFRSTRAQQALMLYGVNNSDPELIFEQIDALLRKGKGTDQILSVIYALEALPDGRQLILSRLNSDTPWRRLFFEGAGGLQNMEAISNRRSLLDQYLANGGKLDRRDLQPFLLRMVQSGQIEEAFDFFCDLDERCKTAAILDPDFSVFSERMNSTRPALYPFEWNAGRGTGYSANPLGGFAGMEGAGVLLRWNGRGTPTLLSQRGPVAAFRDLYLETDDAQDFTTNFRLQLQCAGQDPISYRLVPQAETQALHFQLAEEPQCRFGTLALTGRYRPQATSARVSVDYLGNVKRDD
jgi:hypothetical protein